MGVRERQRPQSGVDRRVCRAARSINSFERGDEATSCQLPPLPCRSTLNISYPESEQERACLVQDLEENYEQPSIVLEALTVVSKKKKKRKNKTPKFRTDSSN